MEPEDTAQAEPAHAVLEAQALESEPAVADAEAAVPEVAQERAGEHVEVEQISDEARAEEARRALLGRLWPRKRDAEVLEPEPVGAVELEPSEAIETSQPEDEPQYGQTIAAAAPAPAEQAERPPFPEVVWVDPETGQSALPLPGVELEEPAAFQKPRSWWRRGRKESIPQEETPEDAATESMPGILEGQVPLPFSAGDAPTPSAERASESEKRSIIEAVDTLADLETEAGPEQAAPDASATRAEPEEPVQEVAPEPVPEPPADQSPEDPSLRLAAMREMIGLGTAPRPAPTAQPGAPAGPADLVPSGPSADPEAPPTSATPSPWSPSPTTWDVPTPQHQPEEKRSKLPWKRSKRKQGRIDKAMPASATGASAAPAWDPNGAAMGTAAYYQVPAAPPSNGETPDAPNGDAPAVGAAKAMFLACSRCGQPSPGGGLCEACDDALSQLRQLTAALLEAGE
jgi:hypothetical protein